LKNNIKSSILIQGDSQLVIKQVKGEYNVRNRGLRALHNVVEKLLSKMNDYLIEYIPRRLNGKADSLANLAMSYLKSSDKNISSNHTLNYHELLTYFDEAN